MDFGDGFRYKKRMKVYLSGLVIFSCLFSAVAKPGEPYALTGREKSIFSIYQSDMKAFPELYEGVDINAYYEEFKTLNNLGDRKLQLGEELMFPHTKKSKKILADERAKAARAVKDAEAAAARALAKETAAENPEVSGEELSLFGSDTRSRPGRISSEAARKSARQMAVYDFQHTFLPQWVRIQGSALLETGSVDGLITRAKAKVDEDFAASLALHRYPDKNMCILEFEKPQNVSGCFFVAIKAEESGRLYFYALEKGISFFGAGDESVFFEWRFGGDVANLGGRDYNDLSGFLRELEAGRPVSSITE